MKNKLLLLLLFIAVSMFSLSVQGQQLAFPGAEGFGKYAKGARGVSTPTVFRVTSLEDSGPGTLRQALEEPGRIVVFDVSGVIKLKSRLVFKSNSYIAGQTAPGDGIIIYGEGASASAASNLIIRHLRIYLGNSGTKDSDTFGVANGTDMIFDHMSLAWGLDETFSVNWDSKGTEPGNITIQNSIIGQGILTHSAGGLIQTNNGISILGCLYIDNSTRNPKVKGLNQYINNVVYNWGGSDGYIFGDTSADSWGWLEGNYFIGGPKSSSTPFTRTTSSFQLYQANNYVDVNKNGVADGIAAVASQFGSATIKNSRADFTGIPKVHPDIDGGILSPEDALAKVIASVGASLPARTHVDDYMIDELLSYGTEGKFLAHEREAGLQDNLGVISTASLPANYDSDGDGMPDWWEDENGLSKNNASDAVAYAANGYLNIENYINSISGPVVDYVRCASKLKLDSRTLSSVTISWQNNTADADQIVVQKSDDGVLFNDVATIAGTEASYTYSGLAEDTYYYFRLITKKSGLNDSPVSEVLRETSMGPAKIPDQATVPTPATNATTRYYTSVDFSWEDTTRPWGGNITYDVYFGASADALTKVAEGLTEKSFTFTEGNMDINTPYYWRVDNKNDMGTTTGNVWSFTSGMYSFTTTYVDLGVDFAYDDGQGKWKGVDPQSNIKLSSSKTYTVMNEMTFTVSGSGATMQANDTKDNLYGDGDGNQSSTYWAYIKMTADADYIQGVLTSGSAEKDVASVKINGTSDNQANTAVCYILFSDDVNFNTKSIIGYERVELAKIRFGNTGTTVSAPLKSKSFRIYRTVTVGIVDDNVWEINGSVGTEILKGTGQLRIGYIGANLQLESLDDPEYKDPNNNMKSLTINGKSATYDADTKTFTCEFMKGTILGEWPVTFVLESSLATADFTSGSSYNFANGPLTIKVTAQNEDVATYTVTATVSDQTTVGILTTTGGSVEALLLSAFADYNVQYIDASASVPADINTFYQNYDLIVLHTNVGGTNDIGLATREMAGIKPVLNLKAFFYNSGRWNWLSGNASNTEAGRTTTNVSTALQNHPIFTDVTFNGENLELYTSTTVQNAFQYVGTLNGSNWTTSMNAANSTLATIDGDVSKIHMHELNMDNSAKYMFIGLSYEDNSYTRFTTNAVTMLKNAAAYLLNPNVYYDYTTNSTVGIKDDVVNASSIQYMGKYISNPDQEEVMVFNGMGILVLTSNESTIDVQHLTPGLYIAKAKTAAIKFIKK